MFNKYCFRRWCTGVFRTSEHVHASCTQEYTRAITCNMAKSEFEEQKQYDEDNNEYERGANKKNADIKRMDENKLGERFANPHNYLESCKYSVSDDEEFTPGNSFGVESSRIPFYRPITRLALLGNLGRLMPIDTPQSMCINVATINYLCAKYNLSAGEVISLVRSVDCDINKAVNKIMETKKYDDGTGNFGVVCLESYIPETFCLASFCLPDYHSVYNDELLDVIHELTLSAAEIPLDTPQHLLKTKFLTEWTTEDGTQCSDLLEEYNISVKDIIMLPHGEYSVQGFFVYHPIKSDIPNIGVAAAACCLDMRSGIHNRFRFHFERVTDSISEHLVQESIHYDQGVHLLRQPYWFKPEYSVEEMIRYKESIFEPSAQVHEMRYAMLFASSFNLPGRRNLAELERLKKLQYRYNKPLQIEEENEREFTNDMRANNRVFLSDPLTTSSASFNYETNSEKAGQRHYEAVEQRWILKNKDNVENYERIFNSFYRNNYY